MKPTLRLGRVAGLPVGAHWSVVLIIALLTALLGGDVLPAAARGYPQFAYWLVAVATAVAFFGSLLAHELAHALVARQYGMTVHGIVLWMLGGATQLESEPPTARADLLMAAAGPATSLAVAGGCGGGAAAVAALGGPPLVTAALAWLALMNAVLAVFNLLPGAPLDGGRVLRAALWAHYRDRVRAARAAARAGKVLGGLMIAAGLVETAFFQVIGGVWLMLIGWFLVGAAAREEQVTVVTATLRGRAVRDIMTPEPLTAPAWVSVEHFLSQLPAYLTQTVFPVLGFDGRPVGVLGLDQLARVPPEARADTRLEQAVVAMPWVPVVAPDDPATVLLERPFRLAALVVWQGVVVGIVTPDNLARAVRLGELRPRDDMPREHPTRAA